MAKSSIIPKGTPTKTYVNPSGTIITKPVTGIVSKTTVSVGGKSYSGGYKGTTISEKQAESIKKESGGGDYYSERQGKIATTYRKMGYDVDVDKSGALIAKKGGRQLVIDKYGSKIVEAPVSAKIDVTRIPTKQEQAIKKFKAEAEAEGADVIVSPIIKERKYGGVEYTSKKDITTYFDYPFGIKKQKASVSELSRGKQASKLYQEEVKDNRNVFQKFVGGYVKLPKNYLSGITPTIAGGSYLETGRGASLSGFGYATPAPFTDFVISKKGIQPISNITGIAEKKGELALELASREDVQTFGGVTLLGAMPPTVQQLAFGSMLGESGYRFVKNPEERAEIAGEMAFLGSVYGVGKGLEKLSTYLGKAKAKQVLPFEVKPSELSKKESKFLNKISETQITKTKLTGKEKLNLMRLAREEAIIRTKQGEKTSAGKIYRSMLKDLKARANTKKQLLELGAEDNIKTFDVDLANLKPKQQKEFRKLIESGKVKSYYELEFGATPQKEVGFSFDRRRGVSETEQQASKRAEEKLFKAFERGARETAKQYEAEEIKALESEKILEMKVREMMKAKGVTAQEAVTKIKAEEQANKMAESFKPFVQKEKITNKIKEETVKGKTLNELMGRGKQRQQYVLVEEQQVIRGAKPVEEIIFPSMAKLETAVNLRGLSQIGNISLAGGRLLSNVMPKSRTKVSTDITTIPKTETKLNQILKQITKTETTTMQSSKLLQQLGAQQLTEQKITPVLALGTATTTTQEQLLKLNQPVLVEEQLLRDWQRRRKQPIQPFVPLQQFKGFGTINPLRDLPKEFWQNKVNTFFGGGKTNKQLGEIYGGTRKKWNPKNYI